MKTLIWILPVLAFFILSGNSHAQCPDNLHVNSQAELDAFLVEYPNCTQIPGVVRIDVTGMDTVNDLSPLQNITSIGDYLSIRNTQVTSLAGLDNLTSVGGFLEIHRNGQLPDLAELNNLTSVGRLQIEDNDMLIEANLPNLNTATGITINHNDNLTSFNLNGITSIENHINISQNAKLQSLVGLSTLTTVSQILIIFNNNQLMTLDGLENLTSVGEYLSISNNPELTNVNGLQGLTSIGGYLQITNNDALPTLNPMDGLLSVGGYLEVKDNATLANLNGLQNIGPIGGDLIISNNSNLGTLNLANLHTIGGKLEITDNVKLVSFVSLSTLNPQTITNLIITGNTMLPVCDLPNICTYLSYDPAIRPRTISGNATGCESVMAVQESCLPDCPVDVDLNSQAEVDSFGQMYSHCPVISGNLFISGSDITDLSPLDHITSIGNSLVIEHTQLSSLQGLENLTTIERYLTIRNNNLLSNLSGLENLTTVNAGISILFNPNLIGLGFDELSIIGGWLSISDNNALASLQSLENVTSIGEHLDITNNGQLTSLTGLDNLEMIGSTFTISNNSLLESVQGLQNVTSAIGGSFHLNNSLSEINLEKLTTLPGSLSIQGNPVLTSLNLNNLTTIGTNLTISNNVQLIEINGFNNLTSIGNDLRISNNQMLTSLENFENVSTIGRRVEITHNNPLSSLQGLHNLDPESISNLILQDNPQLSICDLPNICTYLSYDPAIKPRTISGNATGCESVIAVQELCMPEVVFAIAVDSLEPITVECPTSAMGLLLPDAAEVTYSDNSTGSVAVTWELSTYQSNPGTHLLTGTLDLTMEENPNNLTAQITVIVEDSQAPIHDSEDLPNITAQCMVFEEDVTIPTATDNCTEGVITATTDFAFPTSENGTITWTFTDGAGNTSTQTQDIVIEDNVAPVPNQETLETINAQCMLTEEDVTIPTATDNCTEGVITATTDFAFPTSENGTITWTFTDGAGNTSTQTQDIVIEDNVAPVPNQETLETINAQCMLTEEDITIPTATDNCTEGVITATTDFAFPTAENGTITWTFTDDAGNTSSQTQEIVIQVTSVPEMDCPIILMEGWDPLITYDLPEASDACGPVPVIQTDASGIVFGTMYPFGFKILTFQATNSAGSSTCQVLELILPNLLFLQSSDSQEGDSMRVPASIPPLVSNSKPHTDSIYLIPGAATDTPIPMVTKSIGSDPETSVRSMDIRVYPNPTSGWIRITIPTGDAVSYSIYNHLGQLVKSGQVINDTEIDLLDAPSGMYYLRLNIDQSRWVTKRILKIPD